MPDSFFKTLLIKDATGYHAIAFFCPNNKHLSIKDAVCTVDDVEAIANTDVYQYIPDNIESMVESQIDLKKWGVR